MSKMTLDDLDKLEEAIGELYLIENVYSEPMHTPDWVMRQLYQVRDALKLQLKTKWWHI